MRLDEAEQPKTCRVGEHPQRCGELICLRGLERLLRSGGHERGEVAIDFMTPDIDSHR